MPAIVAPPHRDSAAHDRASHEVEGRLEIPVTTPGERCGVVEHLNLHPDPDGPEPGLNRYRLFLGFGMRHRGEPKRLAIPFSDPVSVRVTPTRFVQQSCRFRGIERKGGGHLAGCVLPPGVHHIEQGETGRIAQDCEQGCPIDRQCERPANQSVTEGGDLPLVPDQAVRQLPGRVVGPKAWIFRQTKRLRGLDADRRVGVACQQFRDRVAAQAEEYSRDGRKWAVIVRIGLQFHHDLRFGSHPAI